MRLAVASISETRALEKTVIEEWGMAQFLLMERAALAVAEQARRAAAAPGNRIHLLAGWGNNGGDALAAARILKSWGHDPLVTLLEGKMTPAARQQLEWARRWGVRVAAWDGRLPAADLRVDGIFGFGLDRAPEGVAAEAIAALAADPTPVIAIDLPSGLDGNTGTAFGPVVRARQTVAAGVLKAGLLCDPALEAVGELWLGEIGFPVDLLAELPGEVIRSVNWPERAPAAHKGTAGFVLVVGGSRAMSGAPLMASLAAGRIGAGLVYAAVPAGIRDVVAAGMPEAVVLPLPEDSEGGIAAEAWETLVPLLERCQAGILGPGLGLGAGAQALAARLCAEWERPLVVDADALRAFGSRAEGGQLGGDSPARGPRVLTPHAGEMARLMGTTSVAVQADRLRTAREAASRLEAVLVLKGARTVVAEPDGRYGVNAGGHPVLATAGSGDVLSGLIGGLLAQGLDPAEAARRGVHVHGRLGEESAKGPNGRSMLSLDMLNCLTDVLRSMTPKFASPGSVPIRVACFARGERSNDAG